MLLGVNIVDHAAGKLAELMAKEQLPWRSFGDRGPTSRGTIASAWNLTATPTLYLIDHTGVIRHKWVGSPDAKVIDAALAKWIGVASRGGRRR